MINRAHESARSMRARWSMSRKRHSLSTCAMSHSFTRNHQCHAMDIVATTMLCIRCETEDNGKRKRKRLEQELSLRESAVYARNANSEAVKSSAASSVHEETSNLKSKRLNHKSYLFLSRTRERKKPKRFRWKVAT